MIEIYENPVSAEVTRLDNGLNLSGLRIHLLISKDEFGVYSAVALNLPGAGSCGDTEDEAIENAKEAVREVLASYAASGKDAPWKDSTRTEIPEGTKQKWIIVYA